MASEEEEASNLLQQGPCFFFYDSFHQEETADPEEIMLFFYPEEVPVQTKLFLLGGCSAMIAFAKNFTEQAVDVVSLKGSTKMAFKQLPGDVTLVLTSNDRKEEDATLCAQLDNLCRAFWFYNGPFEDVLELHRELSRKELLLKFKQIGSLLIPLLQSGYNKLSRTFDVLPYTELPYSNRYFLSASRLLNEIRADCNNIGGSLFYEQTVVCTHLDSDTTRWILNITQIMGASTSRAEVPQYAEEAQKWLHHPFMSTASLKALGKSDLDSTVSPLLDSSSVESNSSPNKGITSAYGSSVLPESMRHPNEQGAYVGLYIIRIKSVSLAVIMLVDALHDPHHINRLKKIFFPKLLALEAMLNKCVNEMGSAMHNSGTVSMGGRILSQTPFFSFLKGTIGAEGSTSGGGSNLGSSVGSGTGGGGVSSSGGLANVASAGINGSGGNGSGTATATAVAAGGLAGSTHGTGMGGSSAALKPTYNSIIYDKTMRMGQATSLNSNQDADQCFIHSTCKAHTMFQKDATLSQVVLRDHQGCVFCRRTWGREIYYHQFHNLKNHYEFMNRIEKTVRKTMKEEHHVNVI